MDYAHPILPFRDNFSAALTWLLRQPDNHTGMLEAVYRQQAIPVRTLAQGVLLRQRDSEHYLLGAESDAALRLLLLSLPESATSVTLYRPEHLERVRERFPGWTVQRLCSWRYPELELPRFLVPFEVWPLDLGDVEDALHCDPTLPVEVFSAQIQKRQVFGACIEDRLAGTIGLTPEGAISWLSVRPDLRGQGIARSLLLWMLRQELQNSHVPFILLPEGHAAEELLRKAGMVKASGELLVAAAEPPSC